MGTATTNAGQLADASRHFARQCFTMGENRLELLIVEVQEERVRLMHAILLALGVAAFGFFALLALNVAFVVLLWNLSPVSVLIVLAVLYASGGYFLYWRLVRLLSDGKTLEATLEQLRKDRECLENKLS